MPQVSSNGLELEYEVLGSPSDPVVLLVMGLGGQLIAWEDAFVAELVGRGFQTIRFDNRDVGRSTWLDDLGVPDLTGVVNGTLPVPGYTLTDMADDAAGLLDALGIDRAHVVGASMGGMIAQTFALRHAERTISLTSIMSTTGDRSVGGTDPDVIQALLFAPVPTTREEAIEAGLAGHRRIRSPGFPDDDARQRGLLERSYDRGYHPAGAARQLLAVLSQPDRTEDLGGMAIPTLVIHGEDDPLVHPSGGRATAAAIKGAELWMVPGMGHDLPEALFSETAGRIAAHCALAV
jgi:pimeloyl-ACP methyl ester carboxylesterase